MSGLFPASPEVDAATLQSLDFPIVCEVVIVHMARRFGRWAANREGSCGKPATGLLICRCCERTAMACAEHVRHVLEAPLMGCPGCNAVDEGRELFEFRALPPARAA